jgi:hypothetical protein
MTANEVISKWRGECEHSRVAGEFGMTVTFLMCEECEETVSYKQYKRTLPDYSSDPGAWTPELFDKIEGEDLEVKFMSHLEEITGSSVMPWSWQQDWVKIRSTPAQKAGALSRAITEAWNEDAKYQTRLVQEDR